MIPRCMLKAAHQGPHQWLDREGEPILGDCLAQAPSDVLFGTEHRWKWDSGERFLFCRRCGCVQHSPKAAAPCQGTFDSSLKFALTAERTDCAAYIGQRFTVVEPRADAFFPLDFTVVEQTNQHLRVENAEDRYFVTKARFLTSVGTIFQEAK